MQDEIQRQIERNEQRTIVLALAAVANAAIVALLTSLALGSTIPALVMLLTMVLWIIGAYWTFESSLIHGIDIRSLTIRERHRVLPLLDRIAQRLDVAPPRLLVQADPMPNALAFGAGARSTIIVTDSLLQLLDDDELEGVLAHECAHVANHDTEIAALSAALLGWAIVVAFLVSLLAIATLAWGIGMLTGRDECDRDIISTIAGIVVGTLLITLAIMVWIGVRLWLLISELTHLAISREREWLADATAAHTTGKPLALASALEKADAGLMLPTQSGVWVESLTIVGRPRGRWRELFDTHPDIVVRIKRLRSFAVEPEPKQAFARDQRPRPSGL